jgi:hypothetical protein
MTNRTNREVLLEALRRGASVLADFAYGIDAGNAIRHGMPVPPRRGRAGAQARPVVSTAGCTTWYPGSSTR